MINTLNELCDTKDGDWLSGGGECCGFDAFIDGDKVICEDRLCGHGTIWEGAISLSRLMETAKSISVNDLEFDKFGEAHVHIEAGVYFVIDKNEPALFNLKREPND